MCPKNTPPESEKSIGEALRTAREFYDRMRNTKNVRRGIRLAAGGIRGLHEVPKSVYSRDEFSQWLDGLCGSFSGSGVALRQLIPYLVALACDAQEWTKDWRAPGWLVKWPKGVQPQEIAARERLGEAETLALIQKVESYARKRRKQFAPPITPKKKTARARGRASDSAIIDVFVANIKRDNRELASNIREICILLDRKTGMLLPSAWKKAGKKSWHEAWMDPKFRPRVKRRISPVRPALKS